MKDYNLYARYETFVNQLKFNSNIEVNLLNIAKFDLQMYKNTYFKDEICKKCYTDNDVHMQITNHDTHSCAYVYHPCVDNYQKQYTVCVVYCLINKEDVVTPIFTQSYRETVNPIYVTNAVVKDILNTLKH